MKYKIYCITNTVNGKKYIGFTGRDINRRFQEHVGGAKKTQGKRSRPFYKAILKHGEENFVTEVVFESDDREQCLAMETQLINEHHTWLDDPECNGYNTTTGGRQAKRTQEVIENHRLQMKGRPKPEGFGAKISAATSGEKNGMYGLHGADNPNTGYKHTQETLDKMSIAAVINANIRYDKVKSGEAEDWLHTLEAASKISATQKAKGERGEMWIQSPEGRKHMSEVQIGKKQTENQKSMARQANTGNYLIEKESGERFVIQGLATFAESIGITPVQLQYSMKSKKFKNGHRLLEKLGKNYVYKDDKSVI